MDSNSARAEPGWPQVVVAGGFLTGIVLMRNLVRRGLRASCIDYNPAQPAFRTVYGKTYLCPNPDDDSEGWYRFMKDLAGKFDQRPVLIPANDQFVTAIATHFDGLKEHFIFCQSSAATQALLATKQRQYEIASEYGLPVPRTSFVSSHLELAAFGAQAQFPCLLKPLHFREWERVPADHPLYGQKVALAYSAAELEDKYRLACDASPELVVQEVIEGPDTAKLVYLSCYDTHGDRIGACMVRQLRTDPIYFGSASVVEPVEDPEADRLCDQFLRGIGYVGICEIELKRDSRDGRVKMIEANPRYSVTADAAPYAGVDLGWLHYLDLIGKAVKPVEPSRRNFRHIVLMRDFETIRSYRRVGLLTWGGLIRSYRPPVAFFDFDPRDWRVTASTVVRLARIIFGPWWRRIFPKRAAAG